MPTWDDIAKQLDSFFELKESILSNINNLCFYLIRNAPYFRIQ